MSTGPAPSGRLLTHTTSEDLSPREAGLCPASRPEANVLAEAFRRFLFHEL